MEEKFKKHELFVIMFSETKKKWRCHTGRDGCRIKDPDHHL